MPEFFTSRVERVCQECGKRIAPGDQYLYRPRVRFSIRCLECYNKSRQEWLTRKRNSKDNVQLMVEYLSDDPVSESDIQDIFGDRYLQILRTVMKNYNVVVGKEDDIAYYHISKDDDISEEDAFFSDLIFITFRCCLQDILSSADVILKDNQIVIKGISHQVCFDNFQPSDDTNPFVFHFYYDDGIYCGYQQAEEKLEDFFHLSLENSPALDIISKLMETG